VTAQEHNRIKDESNDRKYFLMRPAIVKMKARSVYDVAVWDAIKEVAGENGECFLSSENLAALAMVSVGQLSDSRKYLIEVGLLEGEIRKRSEHGQAMWHLRIPDLWEENMTLMSSLTWREKYEAFRQRDKKQPALESLHHMKPSPHEGKPSPHEGSSPQKPSPHETEEEPYRIRSQEREEPSPLFSEKLNGKDFLELAAITAKEQRQEVEPNAYLAELCESLFPKMAIPNGGNRWRYKWGNALSELRQLFGGVEGAEQFLRSLPVSEDKQEQFAAEKATSPKGLLDIAAARAKAQKQATIEAATRAETRARYEARFQASVAAAMA
jgi:hypothetical protein